MKLTRELKVREPGQVIFVNNSDCDVESWKIEGNVYYMTDQLWLWAKIRCMDHPTETFFPKGIYVIDVWRVGE